MHDDVVIKDIRDSRHHIARYEFKELVMDDDVTHIFEPTKPSNGSAPMQQNLYKVQPAQEQTPTMSKEVAEKIEQLFGVVSTFESRFASQNTQIANYFENDKLKTYEDGVRFGENQATQAMQREIDEVKSRLVDAINTISDEAKKFQEVALKLEHELVEVAIDIAKQVVEGEISKDSTRIAINLSKKLISDLDDATNITIKTNPVDYPYLKESLLSDTKVKIESDKAIAKGGVVLISDVGGIDGTIKERFLQIGNLARKE